MTPQEIAVLRDKIASRRSEWQRLTPDGKREFAMLHVEPLMGDGDLLLSHVAAVEQNLEAGTRELRRYVEGNGFTWCEDESTVFNVTTAIGWLGGALETATKQLAAVEAERDKLREALGMIETQCVEETKQYEAFAEFTKETARRTLRDPH